MSEFGRSYGDLFGRVFPLVALAVAVASLLYIGYVYLRRSGAANVPKFGHIRADVWHGLRFPVMIGIVAMVLALTLQDAQVSWVATAICGAITAACIAAVRVVGIRYRSELLMSLLYGLLVSSLIVFPLLYAYSHEGLSYGQAWELNGLVIGAFVADVSLVLARHVGPLARLLDRLGPAPIVNFQHGRGGHFDREEVLVDAGLRNRSN